MSVTPEVAPTATATAGAARTPVLELRKASKIYPGTPPVRALDRVTLDVVAGEMVSIVGPSGSGKSTLLHLIGALDRPSRGTVRVAGADLRALRDPELSALRASRIGFVFQQFHLLEGLSAEDNVAAGLLYRGVAPAERRRGAADALARVGLGHRLGHRPLGAVRRREAAGGDRQGRGRRAGDRAGRRTDGQPRLGDRRRSPRRFRTLHLAGHTIVLITHDPQVAAAAPRTVSLRDGRVESDHPTPPAPTAPGPDRSHAQAGEARP